MHPKTIGSTVILSTTIFGAVLAAGPGPEAACNALAEETRSAVVLKKQGLPVDEAIKVLSSKPVPDTVPPEQADFFKKQLPGAARFAYMAGISADGAAKFYLKQCRIGS
ncbi:MAG: hypothetical protein M9907_13685 [Burkholderiaceae bacterium]|nr:hypothetical protein [Burkholderiaceae bacterium]